MRIRTVCSRVWIASLALFHRLLRLDQQMPTKRFAASLVQGELRTAQRMLDAADVDPNGCSPDGVRSWLRYTVDLELGPQTQLLLQHGADPTRSDGTGISVADHLRQVGRIDELAALVFGGEESASEKQRADF